MPFGQFEDMSKQQMVMFERAMKMFNPFYSDEQEAQKTGNGERARNRGNQIQELRAQLNKMQKQLNALTKGQDET